MQPYPVGITREVVAVKATEVGPSGTETDFSAPAASTPAKIKAYLELTKPRITFLVVLTAAAGFCLGAKGSVSLFRLFGTLLGIALLSAGIGTLNQYMERGLDGLMNRTKLRPLPAGKLRSQTALRFGLLLSGLGILQLAVSISLLTAALGVATFVGYLLAYTPLKTRSSLSTVVGAFPGAMPPLIGWAAARGTLGIEAWILFAILFLWQFPHFLAIAWMYREDYARAGIKMLPVVEPEGRITGQQIVTYTLMLLPVSMLPALVRLAGTAYLAGALGLGIVFLYFSARMAMVRTRGQARMLFRASILYLPALFILMVLNP
ncbi:MAG TPA: heme o synthase [Blastocatellia bacterium]|nr:heme o synthase [Blastocatellia bacterium]